MTFTVKRSEWFRGRGRIDSYLLKADGMKCCVGFVCLQLGLADTEIIGERTIHQVLWNWEKETTKKFAIAGMDNSPSWLGQAYATNDDDTISDVQREERLKALFKQGGHQIEFVD
jgi:hypothetical protein